MLNQFNDSVISNTNLPKIVAWARNILAETNSLQTGERSNIDQDKVPRELYNFYHGPNADVATPIATIHGPDGKDRFITVNYLPGSVFRYTLIIGGQDFNLPPNRLREWKKLQDGVFVGLDWP